MTLPALVLIVDDEPAIRRLLPTGLHAEGYRTEEAATGAEALAKAGMADVVVLDLGLLAKLRGPWGDVQQLRVYVRQIRQKIEADPERPRYLLTETGVGYRLATDD